MGIGKGKEIEILIRMGIKQGNASRVRNRNINI